jgi:hypothetical protein
MASWPAAGTKSAGATGSAEREAASEVLEENLGARESGDWKTQCATLTVGAKKGVVEEILPFRLEAGLSAVPHRGLHAPPSTKPFRANTMTGPIDVLRVKGDRGFTLYHGAKGKDYAMEMRREDGEWRVDSMSPRNSNSGESMNGIREKLLVVVVVVAVLAIAASGCGSGSASSAQTSSSKAGSSSPDSGGNASQEPSKEFRGKGENGTLAKVGREASPSEREAVSSIVEESLRARAGGDWETQCDTFAASLVAELEKTAKTLGAKPGCPDALETQAAPFPESARANTMTGPIDALRIKASQAFAFYHGTKGKDYVLPLIEEGGEWKVASLQEQQAR